MAFKNLFEAVGIQNTLLQRILLDISYWPWIFSMSCTEIALFEREREANKILIDTLLEKLNELNQEIRTHSEETKI